MFLFFFINRLAVRVFKFLNLAKAGTRRWPGRITPLNGAFSKRLMHLYYTLNFGILISIRGNPPGNWANSNKSSGALGVTLWPFQNAEAQYCSLRLATWILENQTVFFWTLVVLDQMNANERVWTLTPLGWVLLTGYFHFDRPQLPHCNT